MTDRTRPGQSWTVTNVGKRVMFGELTPTWKRNVSQTRSVLKSLTTRQERLNDAVFSGGFAQNSVGQFLYGGSWDDGRSRFCRWDNSNRLVINKNLRVLYHIVPDGTVITRICWCLLKDKALLLFKQAGLFYIHSYTIEEPLSSPTADNLYFVDPVTSVQIEFNDTVGKYTRFSSDSRTLAYTKQTSTGPLTWTVEVKSVYLSEDLSAVSYLTVASYYNTDRDHSAYFDWFLFYNNISHLEMQGDRLAVYPYTFSEVWHTQSSITVVQTHVVQLWRLPVSNNCSTKYESGTVTDKIYKDTDQSLLEEGSLVASLFSPTKNLAGNLVGWVEVTTEILSSYAVNQQETTYARSFNLFASGLGATTLCGFNWQTGGGSYLTDDLSFYQQALPPDVHTADPYLFKRMYVFVSLSDALKIYVEYLNTELSPTTFSTCRVVVDVNGVVDVIRSWVMPTPIASSSLDFVIDVYPRATYVIGKHLCLFRFYADRGNTSLGSRYIPLVITFDKRDKSYAVDSFIANVSDMNEGIAITL